MLVLPPALRLVVEGVERRQHALLAEALGLTLEAFYATHGGPTLDSNVIGSAGNESKESRPRPVTNEAAPAA